MSATDLVVLPFTAYALSLKARNSVYIIEAGSRVPRTHVRFKKSLMYLGATFRTKGSQTDLRQKAMSFSTLVSDNLILNSKYF